jgi:hypothetical protein
VGLFELHQETILRFIWDTGIPFDNNQDERDTDSRSQNQRVSTFRTLRNAEHFARIRSVISKFRKQHDFTLAYLNFVSVDSLRFKRYLSGYHTIIIKHIAK